LSSDEVVILTDVWHAPKYFGQPTPPRTPQHGLQDFAMFLLGTAIMLCGTLLQRLDYVLR
jgi:hypothetical protein